MMLNLNSEGKRRREVQLDALKQAETLENKGDTVGAMKIRELLMSYMDDNATINENEMK